MHLRYGNEVEVHRRDVRGESGGECEEGTGIDGGAIDTLTVS